MEPQTQPTEDQPNLQPPLGPEAQKPDEKKVEETRDETQVLFSTEEPQSTEGSIPLNPEEFETKTTTANAAPLPTQAEPAADLPSAIAADAVEKLDQIEQGNPAPDIQANLIQQKATAPVAPVAQAPAAETAPAPLTKELLKNKFDTANAIVDKIKTMNKEEAQAIYTDPEWEINNEEFARMNKIRELVVTSRTPQETLELFNKLSMEDQELFDRATVRNAAESRVVELRIASVVKEIEEIPVAVVEPAEEEVKKTA